MKKIISAILATAVFMLSINIVAFSDDTTDYVFSYTTESGEATITGIVSYGTGDMVIPEYISDGGNTYTVTAIKANAFKGDTKLSGRVEIPSTVMDIGEYAFQACTAIKTVIIEGEGVTVGKRAFSNCNALNYIVIPKNASVKDEFALGSIRTIGGENVIEFSEGVTTLGYQTMRDCARMTQLIMPSTLSNLRLSAVLMDKFLEEWYFLSDTVNFTGPESFEEGNSYASNLNPVIGSAGLGKNTAAGSTKIYVVNNEVKQAFLDKGWPLPDRIEVLAHNNAFFYDSFLRPVRVEDEDDDGYITAPEPRGRDGYKFLYWDIDGNMVFPNTEISLSKSRVITGKWVKDTEEKTVLYKNISKKSVSNDFDKTTVNRIVCDSIRNTYVDVEFIKEDGTSVIKNVYFDKNGIFVNYSDNTEYKNVTMPAGYNYDNLCILTKTEDNFSVDVTLRQPQIIAMPKIDGVDDMSQFDWSSSDPLIVSVADGVVEGLSNGTATITASYNDTSYSFVVNSLGEIAIYEKSGNIDQYFIDKKNAFDAINNAVKSENPAELVSVIKASGDASLSYIKDIDIDSILALGDSELTEFAKRIITYKEFKFETIDDVYDFINTITREFIVGKVNSLSTAEEISEVFENNNSYYDLPLTNKYYLKYKEDCLNNFINYTAVNSDTLKSDFIETYLLTTMKKCVSESGYTLLRTFINDSADEIGYDADHYSTINNSAFHKKLLADIKKGSVNTVEKLKNYIDTSKGVKDDTTSGGGGGGGSISGGGAVIVNKDTEISIKKDEYSEVSGSKITPDTSSVFSDIATDRWSYEAVQYLVAKKVISGYEDGSFKPEDKITRAEFIKIITNAFGFEYEQSEGENVFSDAGENDWYYKNLISAYNNKIVTGDNEKRFNPDNEITRQEMAAIIYRAVVAKNVELGQEKSVNIKDKADIADWAYTPVFTLVSGNIVSGYEDGSFMPNKNATREEAAKLIYNVMTRLEKIGNEGSAE